MDDDEARKPFPKLGGLEQRVAELLWCSLRVVEDQPAPSQEVAVDVVEVVAFQGRIYVALVVVARVVGVLPLAPLIVVVQLVRQVPLAPRRIDGVQQDPRPLRGVAVLVTLVQAQTRAVILLSCRWQETDAKQAEETEASTQSVL